MGGSSSKAPIKAKTVSQIIENSSGTHLFEIHLPSIGFSGAILIFFVTLFCVILAAFRLCRRPARRPPAYSMAPPPYNPWLPGPGLHGPPWASMGLHGHVPIPMGLAQSPLQFMQALEAGPHHSPSRRLEHDRFQEVEEGTPRRSTIQRPSGQAPDPPGLRPATVSPTATTTTSPSYSALAGRFATRED